MPGELPAQLSAAWAPAGAHFMVLEVVPSMINDQPKVFLSAHDVKTLKQVARRPVTPGYRGPPSIAFSSATEIEVSEERWSFPALKPLKGKPKPAKPAEDAEELPRCARGERACLMRREERSREMEADVILITSSKGELLGAIASREYPGIARAQHRRMTQVQTSADGTRVLLASAAAPAFWPMTGSFHPFSVSAGGVQLFCAFEAAPRALPPEPPRPAVFHVPESGTTEIALPSLPRAYLSISAHREGVVVLAAEKEARSLHLLRPDGGTTPLPSPPEGSAWARVAAEPQTGALWLMGPGAIATSDGRGPWTTRKADTQNATDFLALPGGRAAFIRSFGCEPGDAGVTEAEIQKLHRDTLHAAAEPEVVVAEAVIVEVGEPGRAEAADRLAAEAKRPGAKFPEIASRARAELGAAPAEQSRLEVPVGRSPRHLATVDAAIASARVGEIVGPVDSPADPYSNRGPVRYLLRIAERRPGKTRSVTERRQELVTLLESGRVSRSCQELTMFSSTGPASMRRLPEIYGGWPHLVALPDGMAVLGSYKLRLKGGQWLEQDPLLDSISRFDTRGAALSGERLFFHDGTHLRMAELPSGRIVASERFDEVSTRFGLLAGQGPVALLGDALAQRLMLFRFDPRTKRIHQAPVGQPPWAYDAELGGQERPEVIDGPLGTFVLPRSRNALWFGGPEGSKAFFHPATRDEALTAQRHYR